MINNGYDILLAGNSCGAANASVKLWSDKLISTPDLAISNIHEIWQLEVLFRK